MGDRLPNDDVQRIVQLLEATALLSTVQGMPAPDREEALEKDSMKLLRSNAALQAEAGQIQVIGNDLAHVAKLMGHFTCAGSTARCHRPSSRCALRDSFAITLVQLSCAPLWARPMT